MAEFIKNYFKSWYFN